MEHVSLDNSSYILEIIHIKNTYILCWKIKIAKACYFKL